MLIAELTFNLSLHRRVPGPLPCLHTTLTHPWLLNETSLAHLWFSLTPLLTETLQLPCYHFIFKLPKFSLSSPTLALSYFYPFRFQLDWFESYFWKKKLKRGNWKHRIKIEITSVIFIKCLEIMIIGAAALILWVELRKIIWEDDCKRVLLCVILKYSMIWTFLWGGVDLGTPRFVYMFAFWTWHWIKERASMPSCRIMILVVFSEYIYGARHCSRHLG